MLCVGEELTTPACHVRFSAFFQISFREGVLFGNHTRLRIRIKERVAEGEAAFVDPSSFAALAGLDQSFDYRTAEFLSQPMPRAGRVRFAVNVDFVGSETVGVFVQDTQVQPLDTHIIPTRGSMATMPSPHDQRPVLFGKDDGDYGIWRGTTHSLFHVDVALTKEEIDNWIAFGLMPTSNSSVQPMMTTSTSNDSVTSTIAMSTMALSTMALSTIAMSQSSPSFRNPFALDLTWVWIGLATVVACLIIAIVFFLSKKKRSLEEAHELRAANNLASAQLPSNYDVLPSSPACGSNYVDVVTSTTPHYANLSLSPKSEER